jgi:hypothetical protein
MPHQLSDGVKSVLAWNERKKEGKKERKGRTSDFGRGSKEMQLIEPKTVRNNKHITVA